MNDEVNYQELQTEWMNKTSIEYDVSIDELKQYEEKQINSFKEIGLDKTMSEADFWDAVQAAILADIQQNVSVEPTEFQMLWIGNYPPKPRGNNVVADCVGYGSLNGKGIELSLITAWNEDVAELDRSTPLSAFTTGFTFFPEDKIEGRFNLSVQKGTDLMADNPPKWAGNSYEDRLKIMEDSIPLVALGNASNMLSMLITPEGKKPYPDVLDLRRIKAFVSDYDTGLRKDGSMWARYDVYDNTFKATGKNRAGKNRAFTVWVDPRIGDGINAGTGSYLEIFGIITRNLDGFPQMTACFVHPIGIKPKESTPVQRDAPTSPQGVLKTPVIKIHPDGV